MIAWVSILENGIRKDRVEIDLMKFSEDSIRERMASRGIKEENFMICGFSDWQIDKVVSLKHAYFLKKYIVELYDGDDFIAVELLKKHMSILEIVTFYYVYATKDEVELMSILVGDMNKIDILDMFYQTNNWINFVNQFILDGTVLSTKKGFYIRKF